MIAATILVQAVALVVLGVSIAVVYVGIRETRWSSKSAAPAWDAGTQPRHARGRAA